MMTSTIDISMSVKPSLWGSVPFAASTMASTRFGSPANRAGYTCVALQGASIRSQVRQNFAPKYDDIIIDVGGRDTGSFRAALTVTNVVVIPVQPRSFDLWSIDQTADLVTEAREVNDQLRAIAVVNEADPFGKDNQKAFDYIREIEGLELAPTLIVRRKAFPNAAAAGLSVLEYDDPRPPKNLPNSSTSFL
jgi:chromosome partitioning protein